MTTIVSILLKASVLFFAAAAVQALLGQRVSAAMRHLLLTLTVGGLLCLPVLSVALPGWAAIETDAPAFLAATPPASDRPRPSPATAGADVRASSPAAPAVGSPDSAAPPPPLLARLRSIALPVLYVAVALVLLARLVAERIAIGRIAARAAEVDDPEWRQLIDECAARLGILRFVRLLRSAEATMPMAFGVRREAILILAIADTWRSDRRRAVIVHELAHIARRDCLTQMLAAVCCAVYWPHPGVWWMARRLRVERELACDDCVLSCGESARAYAAHLLDLAYSLTVDRAPAVAVAMAGRRHLETRMLAILDAARNRATPPFRSRLVCGIVSAAILIPVATATTGHARQAEANPRETPAPVAPSVAAQPPRPVSQLEGRGRTTNPPTPGTWQIRPAGKPDALHLTLTEGDSSHSSEVDIERTIGLAPAQMAGGFGPVYFSVRRDAGTFSFEGFVRDGVGAGTYTFVRDPAFAAALAKQGYEGLRPADQRLLAREDIGLAFIEELKTQGYERPAIADLVRMAQHGVSLSYLRELGGLGYRVQRIEALVKLRDHGVTPEFIRGLQAEGFKTSAVEDLLRARDHGVDPGYIRQLRGLGITVGSLDALIAARDHGVDPDYVREMRDLGYALDLDALIRVRDHGVDGQYVRVLSDLGYRSLTIDTLVGVRDHGLDSDYLRAMHALGYPLPLVELTRARDHGVDPDYIREMASLGYERLPLASLTRLRDQGVDPEFVRDLRRLGYGTVSPEELVRLRGLGVTH
jgi:beta-lactamase regulating signal transducer with metallopeptidase domain